MKLAARLLVGSLTVASLGVASLAPSACSSEQATTTGKRVVLTVKVQASPAITQAFTNARGWSITLRRAMVSTGAMYFYDGATILSANGASSAPAAAPAPAPAPRRGAPRELLRRVFGEGLAFAHPGHYVAGNAKGELLTPSTVDLGVETVLGNAQGVSGAVRSATFSFHSPPVGPLAAELGGHVVVLEGTATKASATRVFRAEIDAADLRGTNELAQVEGCPFAETEMQGDGTVTLTVNVAEWFGQVELDDVPQHGDGSPALIPRTSIAMNGLTRGMSSGLAYTFAYTPR